MVKVSAFVYGFQAYLAWLSQGHRNVHLLYIKQDEVTYRVRMSESDYTSLTCNSLSTWEERNSRGRLDMFKVQFASVFF